MADDPSRLTFGICLQFQPDGPAEISCALISNLFPARPR